LVLGFWLTIGLTVVGHTCGVLLGLLFGLGRMSKRKWIHYPSKHYIDFFRGTPLLVQILLIHLAVIPTIFGHSLGFFISGAAALTLNNAHIMLRLYEQVSIQSIEGKWKQPDLLVCPMDWRCVKLCCHKPFVE